MTPIVAGGIPPSGADFNGILNLVSAAARWAQAGGGYRYDAGFSSAVGGYPRGAMVLKSNFSGYWLNTVENNTSNPDTGGAGWTDLSSPPDASTTVKGIIQIATAEEATDGTNNTKVITPALLKHVSIPLDRIQANWLDSIAGKLLTVGAFGLGAGPATRIADMNDAITPGLFAVGANAANMPASFDAAVLVLRDAAPSSRVVQILITFGGQQIYIRTKQGSAWNVWLVVPTSASISVWSSDTSGYERAYGGMLYQWGVSAAISYNQSVDVTLPLAAPDRIMNVQATLECSTPVTNGAHSAYAEIISKSVIRLHHDDTLGESRPLRIFWKAVCK